MRNITKVGIAASIVLLSNLIALSQYRSGLSGLCRTTNLGDSAFTNMASGSQSFSCPATNVDVVISMYNSSGGAGMSLTVGFDKSMDSLAWSNAAIVTVTSADSTIGARLYYVTNFNVGNYGFARVRAITNNEVSALTNIQVLGSCK